LSARAGRTQPPLDDFVLPQQQLARERQPDGLGGRSIEHEGDVRRPFEGNLADRLAAPHLVGRLHRAQPGRVQIRTVAEEAAGSGVRRPMRARRQAQRSRGRRDGREAWKRQIVAVDQPPTLAHRRQRAQRGFDFAEVAHPRRSAALATAPSEVPGSRPERIKME
jgi:hypothetical protein